MFLLKLKKRAVSPDFFSLVIICLQICAFYPLTDMIKDKSNFKHECFHKYILYFQIFNNDIMVVYYLIPNKWTLLSNL